jgi:hypothetical protein
MWLWVLLYALVVGTVLLNVGTGIKYCLVEVQPHDTAYDIQQLASTVCIWALVVSFLVFFVGIIVLLVRSTSAAGRVVSLIGMGFYYVAASGIVLAVAISGGWPSEILVFILAIAVVVGLPGFFITRKFRQLQEAEYI